MSGVGYEQRRSPRQPVAGQDGGRDWGRSGQDPRPGCPNRGQVILRRPWLGLHLEPAHSLSLAAQKILSCPTCQTSPHWLPRINHQSSKRRPMIATPMYYCSPLTLVHWSIVVLQLMNELLKSRNDKLRLLTAAVDIHNRLHWFINT